MAKFNHEKESGLDGVNSLLSEIEFLNEAIHRAEEIQFSLPASSQVKARKCLQIDPGQVKTMISVLQKLKERRVRDIRRDTLKYGIELSDDEEMTIRM